ncbi:hypothetical protein [Salinisphaera sp.]|uniref:hypothetical protein n=1 Tax=Salinisphaera sp. TaxID=1914330 RepID=UPI003C7CBB63
MAPVLSTVAASASRAGNQHGAERERGPQMMRGEPAMMRAEGATLRVAASACATARNRIAGSRIMPLPIQNAAATIR